MTGDSLGDKAHKVDTSGGTYVEIGEYHVHGASPPIPEPTLMGSDFSERGRILLLIKGDVQSFDRNALVSTLGWMLGVDQERIEIINIRPSNSFLVELEMPLEAAERLYLAIEVEPRVRSVQAPHLRASKGKLDLDEMPQEKREAIEAKLRIGAS
ncbi:MAG: hypothetical protein M5R40_19960 [Anaerolineae bacterium]|nr:hypothetical protein [Anaerolineae bacterium]